MLIAHGNDWSRNSRRGNEWNLRGNEWSCGFRGNEWSTHRGNEWSQR
ncbi:hypothetical protein [Amycolatopsis sp. NPDC058986]